MISLEKVKFAAAGVKRKSTLLEKRSKTRLLSDLLSCYLCRHSGHAGYAAVTMEWNIQARAHTCQSCHKHFEDKEVFHTMLFDQKNGYNRFDVCQQCWVEQFSQGATDRKGFVSYWQTVYTVPPAAPPEPIQKETAETLLRKLMDRNDPNDGPALYILAAMLERKRLIKVKTQLSRDGQRVFVYEHPKTGDIFQIPDPNLQLHQLERVQHEVLHLLQHGLDEPQGDGAQPQADNASTPEGDSSNQAAPDQPERAATMV